MFLDHDDLMVPGALGEMDRMDEQPGVDVVFGLNERFWTDAQGRDLGRPTVVQTLGSRPGRGTAGYHRDLPRRQQSGSDLPDPAGGVSRRGWL